MRGASIGMVGRVRLLLLCLAFALFGGCSGGGPGDGEPPRDECVPSCDGKTCGSDGCSGTCGSCDSGNVCGPAGTCVPTFDPTGTPDGVPPDLIETQASGTLAGAFAVSHLGQAQYSIPLSLPPGRAGLMPSLGLRYDSAAPNSYLGQGWRLDGISVIARCSRTLAQDGRSSGVQYDGTDPFCLDGSRLVPVRGRQNQYRTELDQIARVTARRDAQTGEIDSWTVWRRDGLIHRFGQTAVPAATAGEKDFWLLTRLEDRNGNYATYEYSLGSTSSVSGHGIRVTPSRISYTGHSSGMPPDTQIDFLTDTREDPRTAHHAGWYLESRDLVSTIRISMVGTVLREYRLSYDFARPDHSSSLLAKVTECAPLLPTDQNLVCKPSTRFLYDNTPAGLSAPTKYFKYNGVNPADNPGDVVLDMDGDGRDDMLVPVPTPGPPLTKAHWEIVWGKDAAQGVAEPQFVGQSLRDAYNDPRLYNVLDWDGDGRDDLLMEPRYGSAKYWVLSFKNGAFVIDKTPFASASIPDQTWAARTYVVDADGDGLRDIVRCIGPSNGPWKWSLISAPGGVLERPIDFGGFCFQHYMAIDLDGDGAQELMMQYFDSKVLQKRTYRAIRFTNANPDGATSGTPVSVESVHTSIPVNVTTGRSARPADVNGDGLTDVVDFYRTQAGTTFDVYVNTGTGDTPGAFYEVSSQSFQTPKPTARGFLPGPVIDENADGRDDLMVMAPGYGWMVLRSGYDQGPANPGVPTGFSLETLTHPIPYTTDPRAQAADLDGDGIEDFVAKHSGGHAPMYAHFRRGESAPRVTDIIDGLGQHTESQICPVGGSRRVHACFGSVRRRQLRGLSQLPVPPPACGESTLRLPGCQTHRHSSATVHAPVRGQQDRPARARLAGVWHSHGQRA